MARYICGGWSGVASGDTVAEAVKKATGTPYLPAGNFLWDGRTGVVCGLLVGVADGRSVEEIERDALALVPVRTLSDGRPFRSPSSVGDHYPSGAELMARLVAEKLA